jgi:hypothetical protein
MIGTSASSGGEVFLQPGACAGGVGARERTWLFARRAHVHGEGRSVFASPSDEHGAAHTRGWLARPRCGRWPCGPEKTWPAAEDGLQPCHTGTGEEARARGGVLVPCPACWACLGVRSEAEKTWAASCPWHEEEESEKSGGGKHGGANLVVAWGTPLPAKRHPPPARTRGEGAEGLETWPAAEDGLRPCHTGMGREEPLTRLAPPTDSPPSLLAGRRGGEPRDLDPWASRPEEESPLTR